MRYAIYARERVLTKHLIEASDDTEAINKYFSDDYDGVQSIIINKSAKDTVILEVLLDE